MRQELLVVALFACGPQDGRRDKDVADAPETVVPPDGDPPCAGAVDATGITAAPFPQNALGRSVAVTLAGDAGAVLTCTLDEAPPVWRELVPIDAEWRWVEDVDPGSGFAEPGFDDSGWQSGIGSFGYQDPAATELAPGSLVPPMRVWFRTTFEVDDPAAVGSLTAGVRRDDGVVLYLNGVEVARDNVPALLRMSDDDERTLFPFELDPALLVAGTNTLAAELHQSDGSTDAGFSVRLTAAVDELLPETHELRSDGPATTHSFELFGLLPDATYTCEARSDACDGAVVTAQIVTDPLPVDVRLATHPRTAHVLPGYTLFNHSRPCADDRTNRLFIADPEGRIRWYRELPIDTPSSIDIEAIYLDDGTIVWGGGEHVNGKPQILGLDGETLYTAAYPGVEEEEYHHDIERLPDGRIIGIVESRATDGVDSWTGFRLVEHDPATGEITWQWDAQDAFDRGQLPGPTLGESDPWHANSLAVVDDAEGPGVYVSLYDTSEIIRIDRATGDITWHLGVGQDFTLTGGGVWFDHMHSIDIFPGPNGDRLFLYDNGNTRGSSRAMALELDVAAREATIAWEWTEPTWYEPNWGDADQTADGTVLINMSHAVCLGASPDHLGAFVEVDQDTDEVVWRLDFLDSADSTYRAQRIDGCSLFANDRYCP